MTKQQIMQLCMDINKMSKWVKSLTGEESVGEMNLDLEIDLLGDAANLLACRCNGVVNGFFGDEIDEVDRRL